MPRRTRVLAALVLVLAAGGSALADAPASLDRDVFETTSKVDPRAWPTRRPARGPAGTLRCWQHGRLILDLEGVGALDTGSNPVVTPKSRAGVSVFDFRNGLCVLEREDPIKSWGEVK